MANSINCVSVVPSAPRTYAKVAFVPSRPVAPHNAAQRAIQQGLGGSIRTLPNASQNLGPHADVSGGGARYWGGVSPLARVNTQSQHGVTSLRHREGVGSSMRRAPLQSLSMRPVSRFDDLDDGLDDDLGVDQCDQIALPACELQSSDCGLSLLDLDHRLETDGMVLVDCAQYAPAPETLNTWVLALRRACALGLPPDQPKKQLRPAVRLVWQRRDVAGQLNNDSPKREDASPQEWTLRAPTEKVRQSVEALPEAKALLTSAEQYFDAIDDCMRPQFSADRYSIIKEIRYSDQVDSVLRESTRWHHDGEPIYITALNTWLGETTIYRPPSSDASETFPSQKSSQLIQGAEKKHEAEKNLNVESGKGFFKRLRQSLMGDRQSPQNTMLAFHGKRGANPLWHRSPKTFQPRLLLIYRVIENSVENKTDQTDLSKP